jgi:pimeloyl-ACP methyl ester carboxylesterase
MYHRNFYLLGILVITIVIGIVTIVTRYLREINTAGETLNNLGSQVIETDCGPIEYARVGEGAPVLVVHGTMGGFDAGLMLAKPVIDAGYQVISVSRFGFLRSPLPENASVNMQADAYACLLDALGIQQVAIMTVSGGAISSIRFAARYPERISALIMISPAAPGKVFVAPPPKAALSFMRNDFFYWAMVTYFRPVAQRMIGVPEGFVLTPETDAQVKDILSMTIPSSGRIDGFYFDNYGVSSEFYGEISETSQYSVYNIKAPVLVINALDDPYAIPENVRGLGEKFPRARLYIVPDGGHPVLGHSAEVDAEIIQFLRNNAPLLNRTWGK